ncbi:MAG: hypothetical protein H0V05_00815 [Euzebyaceae bacterium]|nr:hypothetical protein [Euzebyaceae bacterium]
MQLPRRRRGGPQARAVRRRFAHNEFVSHHGDPGDTLHLLATGRVAVRVTTPLGDVAALGAGEQALISARRAERGR